MFELGGEALGALSGWEEFACGVGLAEGGQASDLAGHEGGLDAGDTGGFAGRVDVGAGGLLEVVGLDGAALQVAAKQGGQFEVGDQAPSTREVVAGDFERRGGAPEGDAQAVAVGGGAGGPAGGSIGDTEERGLEGEGLGEFGGGGEQAGGERVEAGAFGLFGDEGDAGAALLEVVGDGEEEGAGSGDDDGAAVDVEARLGEGLEAAGAEDARVGPAGEGEEEFAGAGGEDGFGGVGEEGAVGGFGDEGAVGGEAEDGGLRGGDDLGGAEAGEPGSGESGFWGWFFAAPELAAAAGVIIEEEDALA